MKNASDASDRGPTTSIFYVFYNACDVASSDACDASLRKMTAGWLYTAWLRKDGAGRKTISCSPRRTTTTELC